MADLGDHMDRDHPEFGVRGAWDQAPFRAQPYRHPYALRRLDPRRIPPVGPEEPEEPKAAEA